MSSNKLIPLKVAFTYLGTIIGAGFASGQEILKFFGVFGKAGVGGCLVAGIFFSIIGALIINKARQKKMRSYYDYLNYLFPGKFIGVIDIIIGIFLFMGLTVMLIGGGSLFSQQWGFPLWVGFFLTALILVIVLIKDLEGIIMVNSLLVPVLIIMCLIIATLNMSSAQNSELILVTGNNLIGNNLLISTLLYVSYNLIPIIAILSSLGSKVGKKGVLGALLGGVLFSFMSAVICYSLLFEEKEIIYQAIPMLALANKINSSVGKVFSFMLWFALLTTALSNSYGLLRRLGSSIPWPKHYLILLLILPTLPFAGWSFSQAVETIYPLLGYIGVFFLIAILIRATVGKN